MKKIKLIYLLFAVMFVVVSCSEKDDPTEPTNKTSKKLTFEKESVGLFYGETKEVKILTKAGKVTATSSDAKVVEVKVSEEGDKLMIKGVKNGKAEITAKDGVNTVKIPVEVRIIELAVRETETEVGKNVTKLVVIEKFNGDASKLKVVSSDESKVKAKISKAIIENQENFKDKKEMSVIEVTGVEVGEATLTLTDEARKEVKVKVTINNSLGLSVTSLNITDCEVHDFTIQGGSGEYKLKYDYKVLSKKSYSGEPNKYGFIAVAKGETEVIVSDRNDENNKVTLKVVVSENANLGSDDKFIVNCKKQLVLKDGVQLTGAVVVNDKAEKVSSTVFKGNTNVTSIDFKNVAEIGNSSLQGCTGITKLIFRDLKKIGYPFGTSPGELALKEIYCYMDTPPTLGSWALYNMNFANVVLYVPSAKLDTYKASDFVTKCKELGLKDENIKPIQ